MRSTAVEFQPHQILYIEHQNKRLYVEVIQIVLVRQLCWARPLALLTQKFNQLNEQLTNATRTLDWAEGQLLDLRQGSDLLLPLSLFQVAIDTEVIPILAELDSLKPLTINVSSGMSVEQRFVHHQLQEFVRQICQVKPELF